MVEAILRRYLERTPRSATLAEEACRYLPGGDTRSATHHEPYSLSFVGGKGPRLTDVDGNVYVDLASNYSSLVHGNAHPEIVAAICDAAGSGTAWPARVESQVALARALVDRVASVEQVRFTNSGTEANMLAVGLARAVTGRDLVLMARHGYHGSFPDLEGSAQGGAGPRTVLAPYGDAAAFEAVLAELGERVAIVILEPVLGAGGIIAPPPDFLARVEAAARRHGALLCLDEVVTFRLALGGEQSSHGVRPHLTTFGKLIGGGLPVGAVGGSADVMALLDPRRPGAIPHSGTFNGNPATTAAGAVTMDLLDARAIREMDRLGARLADGLCEIAKECDLPFSVTRAGSLLNLWLCEAPPPPGPRPDASAMESLHLAALTRGVFFVPRGMLALSTVMDDQVIDDVLERMELAFTDVTAALGAVASRR